jgi:hypothetical protein
MCHGFYATPFNFDLPMFYCNYKSGENNKAEKEKIEL